MELPATQAIDDEDLAPTQRFPGEDREVENRLIGTLVFSDERQPLIYAGLTTIGRQLDCTIALTDETVSKRHAEIEAESIDKAIFIRDLGSSNKTKINDTKLRPNASYQIKNNDKLNFGKVAATFKIHQPVDDSIVSCTPQVNRRAAVIPDTPETSMDNSSVMDGDVSTIPGTQADEDDTCFRRPQIPVRTSISNEHESPKHAPFTLDEVPSPLSNNKDHDDISEVETQRYIVDNTKEMTDSSIYSVETQRFEKSSVHSHDNENCKRILENSSVKKVLSEEFANQSLEDVETQQFIPNKSGSSSGRSENTSIYSAKTQEVLPSAREDQSIVNAETQPFIPVKSSVNGSDTANVSIHSDTTQKIKTRVSENESIENLETQPFTRKSLSLVKRKSANTSIYSAETQKASLDDLETQKFIGHSDSSKIELADVSIYSAATQKVESTSENGAIENLETQKFETTRASLTTGAHEIVNESLSISIQDIDTMPFTKLDLPLNEKSNAVEMQNGDDDLLDSTANSTKSDKEKERSESENSGSKVQMQSSFKKSDKPVSVDEINQEVQNQKQTDEIFSKPTSENILQNSSKFDKSKSLVESDDEEEIFSQNLIEDSPFRLLLDDSKNDGNEQSAVDLQNDEELRTEKIVSTVNNVPVNEQDNSTDNENSTKNKSEVAENDDSETDEEGNFIANLSKENKNKKSDKETGNDSETDEEGVFSNHLTEEEGEKSNNKPEDDSATDEEGAFSGHLSKNSKEMENDKIIDESESEDEGISSGNQSNNKASNDFVGPNQNDTRAAEDSSSIDKSAKTVSSLPPQVERALKETSQSVERESPIPESDDDLFNENYEENRASSSKADELNSPATDEGKLDSVHNTSIAADSRENKNGLDDVDELAPTQIVETEDLSLAPTQIVNRNRAFCFVQDRSEEADELAPTQLMDTQSLAPTQPIETESLAPTQLIETESLAPTQLIETQSLACASDKSLLSPAQKAATVANSDMDLAPTQKLVETQDCTESLAPTQKVVETQECAESLAPTQKVVETQECAESLAPTQKVVKTQECAESLAPTQKVVDTQPCSEEMGALQFTESLGQIQIIETQSNDVENEIVTSPKVSPNKSKRQLEEVEITSNKKLKTNEALPPKVNVDLNSTVEQNLNEMFEGSEDKIVNVEQPIATQQLESILESSQIEESPATAFDVSINKPSPTLSTKRCNMRNRRRTLMLNKSAAMSETNKSVTNLNDTIEKNLNELFDSSADSAEGQEAEPEPMLTQQLENVLSSSQESDPAVNKEDEGRTLNATRRKSRLSLSMNLNNSMLKTQKEKEAETTPQSSLDEKPSQNEDYSANLAKDNVTDKQITSENDKDIVYRRGTIGFSPDLKAVSRDSKKTATTSRTSGSTSDRTKRIIDSDDDDRSTQQPSAKRAKTVADRQMLQQATVVISPLRDKLIKLRDVNRLNIANALDDFKQPTVTVDKKKGAKATKTKTLDSYVTIAKTARTDSSDLSAVESSIVEDNSEKPKTRGRLGARDRKAKVDTSSERNASNASKENVEESDVQKPKTRGRGRRNQATESSVSERDSSKDEISSSSVENKSTRSTRGRLGRRNNAEKEEAKATVKNDVLVQDSDSDESEQPKITAKKNTRGRLAKTVDQTSSSKIDIVVDSKHDKIQDKKEKNSQPSSQSDLVTVRSTRTRNNKLNQESDPGSSDTQEVPNTTRSSKRKPANNKSDFVVKTAKVDSIKETKTKNDETEDEIDVSKLAKKKTNAKSEEPTTAAPARKTRARATKNTSVAVSSPEESEEVSEIMKSSVSEDSKPTTRRRGRQVKSNASNVESTESSDEVFEKPTARPKRARLTKADKNKSSHVSDTEEDSSHKSTRRKHTPSPSPSPTPPSDAAATLTPSRVSRLSLSPSKRPKVLFTGDKSEAHRSILKKLGGIETEDFDSCSVLITDKVRRTFKFLCSLARGIPIASVKWLDDSNKAKHFLDLEDYILNDPEAEAKFKFNLKKSLDKSRKHKLLEGYTVVLAPKIKQPPIAELKEMVISSGGKPLVRAPAKWSEKSLVVTTNEEVDSAKKLIAKAPKSVKVHSIEFILTGILRQETNFTEFKLLG